MNPGPHKNRFFSKKKVEREHISPVVREYEIREKAGENSQEDTHRAAFKQPLGIIRLGAAVYGPGIISTLRSYSFNLSI